MTNRELTEALANAMMKTKDMSTIIVLDQIRQRVIEEGVTE